MINSGLRMVLREKERDGISKECTVGSKIILMFYSQTGGIGLLPILIF